VRLLCVSRSSKSTDEWRSEEELLYVSPLPLAAPGAELTGRMDSIRKFIADAEKEGAAGSSKH
jgi:hypothetical protein